MTRSAWPRRCGEVIKAGVKSTALQRYRYIIQDFCVWSYLNIMAYAYQPPTVPFHQNTNVFGFLEMPDAPYTDSSSGSGYLRETEDLDLSDDEVEEETMTQSW